MATQGRKRRAPDGDIAPSQTQRLRPDGDAVSSPDMSASDTENGAPSNLDTMVKKMVRLALASEYARLPIRRTDISAKVLGEQGARQFKPVFEAAQLHLRNKFGMEMVELPAREKVTISQRRAAQKSEKPSSASSKSWILTSTLPAAYRTPAILPPTHAPSVNTESTYMAIYSFIIAIIALNGGSLGEQKLTRYLRRMNADDYTPIDKTDKLLARLCREGYLVRTREMDGGEEVIEFMVGPRGKVEVGSGGVAGMVREVYGHGRGTGAGTHVGAANDDLTRAEQESRADFESRLRASLGITGVQEAQQAGDGEGRSNQQQPPAATRESTREPAQAVRSSEAPRRSLRRATTAQESEDEDEEESDEEESDEEDGSVKGEDEESD